MQFLVTIEGNEEAIKEQLANTLGINSYGSLENLIRQCIEDFLDPHTKLEVERVEEDVIIISDPDGIRDRPIMDNSSPKGTKVKFAYENAGTNYHIKKAKEHLILGEVYTVDYTDVHAFKTIVYLQEAPGIEFTSVQFAPLKEDLQ